MAYSFFFCYFPSTATLGPPFSFLLSLSFCSPLQPHSQPILPRSCRPYLLTMTPTTGHAYFARVAAAALDTTTVVHRLVLPKGTLQVLAVWREALRCWCLWWSCWCQRKQCRKRRDRHRWLNTWVQLLVRFLVLPRRWWHLFTAVQVGFTDFVFGGVLCKHRDQSTAWRCGSAGQGGQRCLRNTAWARIWLRVASFVCWFANSSERVPAMISESWRPTEVHRVLTTVTKRHVGPVLLTALNSAHS